MTTTRPRGAGLPETTQRFLAGLPRHGDPVRSVWNRLAELERAGNDPVVVDALRAVLLPHQPPRFGRCPACPKRWGRRRWPCTLWCGVHVSLFSASVVTGVQR
ncbi:MAG: hypothetical protein M3Y48_19400 [Actinomycetota bacterium]|nr:hypothetical protein [Actinomycetota bacterium]